MHKIDNNNLPFKLIIAGVNEKNIFALNFSSNNYALNSNYQFEIKFASSYLLPEDLLTQKGACLQIKQNLNRTYIHGLIDTWQFSGTNIDQTQYIYKINLCSPLNSLAKNVRSQVFVNKSVLDVAKTLLLENDLDSTTLQIKTTQHHKPLEFSVQLNESCLDFFERLLNQHGFFYFFMQEKENAKLIITDNNKALLSFPSKELPYQSHSGAYRPSTSIFFLEERVQYLTKSYQIKDYNNQTPEAKLAIKSQTKSEVPSCGVNYIYGTNHQDYSSGEQLANFYQQNLDSRRHTFIAETDCHSLQPGQTLRIYDHPIDYLNGHYKIITLKIAADQSPAKNQRQNYTAKLELIKANTRYYPAIPDSKKFNHIMSATIAGNSTNSSALDDQGNYRLHLPFAQMNTHIADASPAVSLIQPHLGQHFPLKSGTQVAITFINGELSRPVILGVISHPTHPSTTNSRNHTLNIIRTHGANELVMNDLVGGQFINIATKNAENSLFISAKNADNKISFTTQKGKFSAYAKKMCTTTCTKNLNCTSGANYSINVKNSKRLITQNGHIRYQSANNANFVATGSLRLQTETGDTIFKCSNEFSQYVASNFELSTDASDLQLQAQNSSINLFSKGDFNLTTKQDSIFIGHNTNGISISSNDIEINANRISLNAANINIYQNNSDIMPD